MDFKRLVKNGKDVTYSPPFSSLHELLFHHKRRFAHKEAIVSLDVDTGKRSSITYGQLYSFVLKAANFLHSQGIKPADRFALLMHNSANIMVFELAGGIIGATSVPLDYKRDTLDRKLYKLRETNAKLLLMQKAESSDELKTLKTKVKTHIFSSFDDLKNHLRRFPASKPQNIQDDLSSLYLILYTSGTTAHPKGVLLTTQAMIANAEGIADWQKLTLDDRFNIILPLHHINSTTMSLATLLSGGTIVLSSRYSTSHFWETIAKENVTITSVVPTIIHDVLVRKDEFFSKKKNISLKRILVGSAPVLPKETITFYDTFKIQVYQGYGQTETALRVTGVPIDLEEEEYRDAVRTNTIGLELKNNNVTILRKDGEEAKEKEEGEIAIRGPILAEGYLHDKKATTDAFYNGWFHSGDIGYWKKRGQNRYFYIVGRSKEIIIKGGINLSPALIEDALLKQYSEIDEVSVVGFDDPRVGEEIAAVIVLKKSMADEQSSVREKIILDGQNAKIAGLSSFESPKRVFFVDALPKTSTGKIQRVEVKRMIEKLKYDRQKRIFVRQIQAHESAVLQKATEINNARWHGLPATTEEFAQRANNGLLFGVFDEANTLLGSISCVKMSLQRLKHVKTWNEVSANGTLKNHNPKGDSLVCVAISVASSHSRKLVSDTASETRLKHLAKEHIEEYVRSNKDYVLTFHRKPKGGLPGGGASVWKILENGRVEDRESVGYNVIMKYPDIPQGKKIITASNSASVLLIEYVLRFAAHQDIKHVFAFSRPAGYREYLSSVLSPSRASEGLPQHS